MQRLKGKKHVYSQTNASVPWKGGKEAYDKYNENSAEYSKNSSPQQNMNRAEGGLKKKRAEDLK